MPRAPTFDWQSLKAAVAARRRVLGVIVAAALGAAFLVAIRSLDIAFAPETALLLLVDIVIGAPLAVAAGAASLQASAALAGRNLSFGTAARATAAGVVAEIAPAPGGLIARGAALWAAGASAGAVARALAAGSALGASLAIFGAALGARAALGDGAYLLAGVAALAAGAATLAAGRVRRADLLAALLAAKAAGLVILYGRLALALMAVGAAPGPGDIALMGAAGVLGGAASFAPNALGLREGLAALFATATGFDAAAAFAGMALSRIVGLGVCAGFLMGLAPRQSIEPPQSVEEVGRQVAAAKY